MLAGLGNLIARILQWQSGAYGLRNRTKQSARVPQLRGTALFLEDSLRRFNISFSELRRWEQIAIELKPDRVWTTGPNRNGPDPKWGVKMVRNCNYWCRWTHKNHLTHHKPPKTRGFTHPYITVWQLQPTYNLPYTYCLFDLFNLI